MDTWTPDLIRASKGKQFLPALTTYDYPMTRMLDELGIPMLLVGDSLGMVVLGYPDTTHVTMEDMIHHIRAAARAKPKACLVGDMPYQSYETSEQAVRNARRLVEAGAQAVKLEGGHDIGMQIRAIRNAGIPCVGHLGMLPQHILEEGSYKIKGRRENERRQLLEDAAFLETVGVCALVIELVEPNLSQKITSVTSAPTIGIGSGPHCDGQILVTHDLVGSFPWFRPKFVKPRLQATRQMQDAVRTWRCDEDGLYKQNHHSKPSPAS
ncbi:3-methyl-2-oxobutanoate hydroxymethyltransferase [Verrucomicrobia bacterium]|nr:3-methyl-2-oxobutanoate hydroxymethyltransferase [Verrucomicrobiota bacterium]MDB4665449.1 3-methyl-2-oxobutanoate hydroxymethyltransferase [Verrucomicrobiota bacterium]MDG1891540.1 3-methyl-2-oxobutanoate hydroxymethyltransferase [Verrucomicrobiota bacterium]